MTKNGVPKHPFIHTTVFAFHFNTYVSETYDFVELYYDLCALLLILVSLLNHISK